MILFFLAVVMFVNKKHHIPAAGLFRTLIFLILLIAVADHADDLTMDATRRHIDFPDMETRVMVRTVATTLKYVLRPVVILMELLIICPNKKLRIPIIIPAVINAFVYLPTAFGVPVAFGITADNTWYIFSPIGRMVYAVQLLYVFILILFSIVYFKQENRTRCIVVLAIGLFSVADAVLEFTDILPGRSTEVTAMCTFAYYIYLSTIYQHEMRQTIAEKNLEIARSELTVLKNQMHPHFIYNSLGTIRSLTKRDSAKAVQCIDDFSKYLKSHIGAIRSDDMIPFDAELENVKVYLSMVQAGYSSSIQIDYDIPIRDFKLPPLSLEPIVENAVGHGVGKYGGTITIITFIEDENIVIRVKDSGGAPKPETEEEYKPFHNGIGLDNTAKRLELHCGGKLRTDFSGKGAVVDIILPKPKEEEE